MDSAGSGGDCSEEIKTTEFFFLSFSLCYILLLSNSRRRPICTCQLHMFSFFFFFFFFFFLFKVWLYVQVEKDSEGKRYSEMGEKAAEAQCRVRSVRTVHSERAIQLSPC